MTGRGDPVQVGEVAPGVLQQRALVDHRQLEVRVRVVDRLAPGLDEHDEREGQRSAPVRRLGPDVAAGRRAGHRHEVGAGSGQRGDEQGEHEQGLAEHGEREIARGAHQRESVARVPCGGRHREARERQQPDEHERIVAQPPATRPSADRHEREGDQQAGGRQRRGGAIHRPGAERLDGALAPQAAQDAIGLQRRRAAAPLQARLDGLDRARHQRRQRHAAELQGPGDQRAHPSTPVRTSARRPRTSASRYSA